MGLDMYLNSSLRGEVIYWRKANHIHGWFERKLGNGNELINLKTYPVPISKLEDLVMDCIRVKDSLIAGGTVMKDTVVELGFNDEGPFQKVEPRPMYRNTDLAYEVLPPTAGFFFGGYDIDEWYLKNLEETIKNLTLIIKSKEKGERFYYRAWW